MSFLEHAKLDYSEKLPGYYGKRRLELVDLVPPHAKRLLDVGCSEGFFCEAVAEARPGIETWGIEPMPVSPDVRNRVGKFLHGPIEAMFDQLPDHYFDCVSLNDVLEHLSDPWNVLKRVQSKLADGGSIVVSLPNLRYYPVLKALVQSGDFEYVTQGVLDRTHLRFFTKKSMKRMLEECGYETTTMSGLSWTRFPIALSILNRLTNRAFEDLHYLQFAIHARPIVRESSGHIPTS